MRYLLFVALIGCVDAGPPEDAIDDTFLSDGKADVAGIADGSPEAAGVLAVANDTSEAKLKSAVGLSASAAHNIAAHGQIDSLAELDDIPYVGPTVFRKLLAYAEAQGLVGAGEAVGHGILLDCNTSLGPDQQVTVIGDGTKLTLRELTSSGSQVDRSLTKTEWASHKLKLRQEFGENNTLSKESGSWVMRALSDGFNEIGNADCWVDKSH